ncbi:hypothetical protein HGP14_30620 [Rhizobium sp. P32RR-XVIII]|uniref:hypothetical protein n=1 Tax=Rhizobium sp. P32RR-XVIII TaxID=2726738 RepID=UPI00145774C3|nr:hypothetical protein [Rhizobium sp. P32RR-XVIII]NLS07620.1 hypothetical protein [Rhizobium sp. P32RR-XVIII]
MAVPRPSNARLVIRHYECGKMRVFLDGKPIPGVIGAEIKQEAGQRAILSLSIIGLAYRMETSPLRLSEDREWRETAETGEASE